MKVKFITAEILLMNEVEEEEAEGEEAEEGNMSELKP